MLDDDDKVALGVLVSRIAKMQDVRKSFSELRDHADRNLKETNTTLKATRQAFAAFSFNPEADDLWEQVKASIGVSAWNEAIHKGRAAFDPNYEEHEQTPPESTAGDESTEVGPPSQPTSQITEPPPPPMPSVREIVLEQLKGAGTVGLRAANIRDYVLRTYDKVLHEKTVGMTLYRLSLNGQARREGHVWFSVPSKNGLPLPSSSELETESPGAATPGQNVMD